MFESFKVIAKVYLLSSIFNVYPLSTKSTFSSLLGSLPNLISNSSNLICSEYTDSILSFISLFFNTQESNVNDKIDWIFSKTKAWPPNLKKGSFSFIWYSKFITSLNVDGVYS